MKKIFFFVCVGVSSLIFVSASIWEGAATMSGDLPETGLFMATNSFPLNSVIEVVNLENGFTTRVIVYSGLDTAGFLALLSKDAAEALGIPGRSLGRVRVSQVSDLLALSRFTDGRISRLENESFDLMMVPAEERPPVDEVAIDPSYIIPRIPGAPEDTGMDLHAQELVIDPAYIIGRTPYDIPAPVIAQPDDVQPPAVAVQPEDVVYPHYVAAQPDDAQLPDIAALPDGVTQPYDIAARPYDDVVPPAIAAQPYDAFEPPDVAIQPYDPVAPPPAVTMQPYDTIVPPVAVTQPYDAIVPPVAVTQPYAVQPPPAAAQPDIIVTPPVRVSRNVFSAPTITSLQRGKYYVQIAAYSNAEAVNPEISRIDSNLPVAVMTAGTPESPLYRVLIGPLTLGEAGAIIHRIRRTHSDAFVRFGE